MGIPRRKPRAKRSNEIRVPERRKKKFSPKPHPVVTQALKAEGLDPEKVYRRRRWDDRGASFEKINRALAKLVASGWKVSAEGAAMTFARPTVIQRRGETANAFQARQSEKIRAASLEFGMARGLAYIFDRPAEAIIRHLDAHRAECARLAADPLHWLEKDPNLALYLTKGEVGALSTFVGCHNRYHAAIGNAAYTLAAGTGVPMTEEAIEAIEKEYKRICGRIIRQAGSKPLSYCQNLAAGIPCGDWYILQAAAHAIDEDLPALAKLEDFEPVTS